MNARILATLGIALWLPLGGPAQNDEDVRLQARAERSVGAYSRLTIFDDVSVVVQDGAVTLTGKVTMAFKRRELGERLAAIDGVRALRNEIGVLPVSSDDDDLRKRVARAIYGNFAFRRYAAMPHPPIHIVVENGRVTLAGVVPTDLDRALALSLAAGEGEGPVTCALRTAGPSAP